MADPISIIKIIGTATKSFEFCVSAGSNLTRIRSQWKKAPAKLESIEKECGAIKKR